MNEHSHTAWQVQCCDAQVSPQVAQHHMHHMDTRVEDTQPPCTIEHHSSVQSYGCTQLSEEVPRTPSTRLSKSEYTQHTTTTQDRTPLLGRLCLQQHPEEAHTSPRQRNGLATMTALATNGVANRRASTTCNRAQLKGHRFVSSEG